MALLTPITIAGRRIGPGHPAYIIAEIGSNHDGSLTTAKHLIHLAAKAGADAAKFQLFRADELYPGRTTPGAIPDWWLLELQRHAHSEGIEFLCSVFSTETLAAYLEIDPPAIKIASPEATNLELVQAAAATGPLVIATGATDWQQLDTLEDLLNRPRYHHALLHCVSAYPAPADQLNLTAIPKIAARYHVPVGLSDHTYNPDAAPIAAVALGANIIEKHLTHSRKATGPDHPFALEPHQFKLMVDRVRLTERMLGDGNKRAMPSEDPLDRRQAA